MGKRQAQGQGSSEAVSLVAPGIYLGPCSAASSTRFLSANTVTHVLSVGINPSSKVDGVSYHRLSLTDSQTSSISKIVDSACEIIDAALAFNKGTGKILVHCVAGISRSPMVVAAYLMKKRDMSLKSALGQILRVRPQISPNPSFIQQLKDLELELRGEVSLEVDELPKQRKDRMALFGDAGDAQSTAQITHSLDA